MSVKSFDPTTLSRDEMYKLLIQVITPRPIAFVSSLDSEGRGNLAPFSFFNCVCSAPPTIMIAISGRPDRTHKDTLSNILATKEFVVNSVNEPFLERMVACAAPYAPGIDEAEVNGFAKIPSTKIKVPRIAEALMSMECRLVNTLQFGDVQAGGSTVVFGEVLALHIDESVFADDRIDPELYRAVGRLGRAYYSKLGEVVAVPVPSATSVTTG